MSKRGDDFESDYADEVPPLNPDDASPTEKHIADTQRVVPFRNYKAKGIEFRPVVPEDERPIDPDDPDGLEKVLAKLPVEARLYLGSLRACPSPRQARDAAEVSHWVVANWRKRVPEFVDLENQAIEDSVDTLRAAAYSRAVHGVLKPVYQLGKLVGYEREYSDKLMEVLLKGMDKRIIVREEEKKGPNITITMTAEQVADAVRRLSPTSQPKQITGTDTTVAAKPESK